MNYEQKYKDAIERAKELLEGMDKGEYFASSGDIENIFPELKEKERNDEKIRKAIIAYISYGQHYGISNTDMIAWLKKQGDYNRLVEEMKKRKELLSKEKEKATSANDKLSLGGRIAMLQELLAFNICNITDKDERIRKVIRGWIYTRPASFFDNGISKEEILDWVEKQNKTFNAYVLAKVLSKHLYTCINKTNTYVRSEEDHITLPELIAKIRADLNIK